MVMAKRYAPVRVNVDWEAMVPIGGYDRVLRARGRYTTLPPMRSMSTPRPIAVIEAEIRRAVTPALRSEDV